MLLAINLFSSCGMRMCCRLITCVSLAGQRYRTGDVFMFLNWLMWKLSLWLCVIVGLTTSFNFNHIDSEMYPIFDGLKT